MRRVVLAVSLLIPALASAAEPPKPKPKVEKPKPKAENKDDDARVREHLTRDEVKAGLKTVNPQVAACQKKFKATGRFKVSLTIGTDGTVTKAHVVSKPLAGTPTAECVETAISGATFKKAKEPTSVNYPYVFR